MSVYTSSPTTFASSTGYFIERVTRIFGDIGGEYTFGVSSGTALSNVNFVHSGQIYSAATTGIKMSSSTGTSSGSANNTVTVTQDGLISNFATTAISFLGYGNYLSNAGEITAVTDAIVFTSSGAGSNQVSNTGTINATNGAALQFVGTSSLNTYGELFNSGTITSRQVAVEFGDRVYANFYNTGTITSLDNWAVVANLGYGTNNYFYNSGEIMGQRGLALGANSTYAHVVNTGTIAVWRPADGYQAIESASGFVRLTNSGEIIGDVNLNSASDVVTNSGTIQGILRLGSGNDTYDGIGGSVSGGVRGGAGDDTYTVSDSLTELVENAGEGTDLVIAHSNWKLGANFENLTLAGDQDIRGIGNSDANTLIGNEGDNRLVGWSGDDELYGQGGDDFLKGQIGADTLDGGLGNDTLYGGKNSDRLFGDDGNDILFGQIGWDTLNGMDGDDTLIGGNGADVMRGGRGSDVFVFLRASDSRIGAQADKIGGFAPGDDLVDLTEVFAGELSFIGSSAFGGAGQAELRIATAGPNSNVFVDIDGNGTADMQIKVLGTTGLTELDFLL